MKQDWTGLDWNEQTEFDNNRQNWTRLINFGQIWQDQTKMDRIWTRIQQNWT